MIHDERWIAAKATLPTWARARCWYQAGEIELEFEREESGDPPALANQVAIDFCSELGGVWELVERKDYFKTAVWVYRLLFLEDRGFRDTA